MSWRWARKSQTPRSSPIHIVCTVEIGDSAQLFNVVFVHWNVHARYWFIVRPIDDLLPLEWRGNDDVAALELRPLENVAERSVQQASTKTTLNGFGRLNSLRDGEGYCDVH